MKSTAWSKELIRQEIAKFLDFSGGVNEYNVARDYNRRMVAASERHFGSWEAALADSGVVYTPKRRQPKTKIKWSKDLVLSSIKDLEKRGNLQSRHVQENHNKIFNAARRYFGDWATAVEAAGVNYSEVRQLEVWDKSKVIVELKRIFSESGDISPTFLEKNGHSSLYVTARKLFGNYKSAVVESGIDDSLIFRKVPMWNEKMLRDELLNIEKAEGGLSYSFVRENHKNIVQYCEKTYGGWYLALYHLGLRPHYEYAAKTKTRLAWMKVGYEFQEAVRKVFEALGLSFSYEKSHGNLRPDFTLNSSTWIDAKLSSWTAFTDGTLDKYHEVQTLIIVYLRGGDVNTELEGRYFVRIDDFYGALYEKGCGCLVDEIESIRNKISILSDYQTA